METVLEYLASRYALFTFFLVDVGMYLGGKRIKGVSLGAAAVFFLAIIVSAYGVYLGVSASTDKGGMITSREVGALDLAIFASAVGNSSGRSFFRSLKRAVQPIATMVGILIVVAVCTLLIGRYVFAIDPGTIAGVLAGGITNTSALVATGEASGQELLTTVGYAVPYLFGVLDMIVTAQLALCKAPGDTDTPDPVTHHNVYIERDDRLTIEQIEAELGGPVEISRMRRGKEGSIWIPDNDEVLEKNDLMTVVGTIKNVNGALKHPGHKSSHSLRPDRRMLNFRRIMVPKHNHVGKTVAELDKELEERWGAKIPRVRRGDADMPVMPNFMVELGDRVRVVSSILKLKKISKWLGDSSKGLSDIDPVTLDLSLAPGYFIGEIEFPTPGGGHFTLGYAAGILTVGLITGKVGKIGPFMTALPSAPNVVLAELGLLMFLARAGTNAGAQTLKTFSEDHWWKAFVLGFTTTTTVAVLLYIVVHGVFRMGGAELSGLFEDVQTQPAVLASTDGRTRADPHVALGYVLIYPVAMIVKILLAHTLETL